MSNFDLLYKQYDYNKSFSPSNTNYFEKDIKEGLSFFQQNKLNSTLRNNYFNSNNDSNMKMTSSEKNDKINLEAKKIIEREIEPYLSLMKKELNLIVEKYTKDFQKKNDTINELLNMKNDINNYIDTLYLKLYDKIYNTTANKVAADANDGYSADTLPKL